MIPRVPSLQDYERMTVQAREAAAALAAAVRKQTLAEVAALVGRDADLKADAEQHRLQSLARWHDTPAQQYQRRAELIHSTTRRAA